MLWAWEYLFFRDVLVWLKSSYRNICSLYCIANYFKPHKTECESKFKLFRLGTLHSFSFCSFQEHIQEVLDKWTQIDDEIWAKVIVFERNRRVAKAYARAPVLTVNGSDDGFDGMRWETCKTVLPILFHSSWTIFVHLIENILTWSNIDLIFNYSTYLNTVHRIGLCGFDNPMRDPRTDDLKALIGQGVKVKMDDAGNILVRRYSKSNVFVKSTTSSANEETAIGNEVLKTPNHCVEFDKVAKVFI